jgi:hypothetical protein
VAKRSGIGQRLWWHGRDLSGDIGSLNALSSPRVVIDTPNLNATAMERVLAGADGMIDVSGWFDDASNLEHDALKAQPDADRGVLLAISTTRGDPCAFLPVKHETHTHERTPDGALAIGAIGRSNGAPLEWGVMLTADAETISSAGSLTSLDENSAGSTSNGGVGYLEFVSLSSGNPVLLIRDSTDNSSFATLLTFVEGTPPLGERKTVTGNVDRYLEVRATGTFSNAKLAVGFRRGTAQDDESLS